MVALEERSYDAIVVGRAGEMADLVGEVCGDGGPAMEEKDVAGRCGGAGSARWYVDVGICLVAGGCERQDREGDGRGVYCHCEDRLLLMTEDVVFSDCRCI